MSDIAPLFPAATVRRRLAGWLLLLLVSGGARAQDTILWVTNQNIGGPGSLIAAIQALQPSHPGWQEIRFNLGPGFNGQFLLSGPLPAITGPRVLISGTDFSTGIVIDGNFQPIFHVGANATTTELRLRSLRLQRGGRGGGGGCLSVLRPQTHADVQNVTFDQCRGYVGVGTPARGGAIRAEGRLTVADSIFTGNQIVTMAGDQNTSDAWGGAIGAYGDQAVLIERSLFQDNENYLINTLYIACESGHGGAIGLAMASNASAVVRSSTFLGNRNRCRPVSHPADIIGMGDGGAIVLYGRGDYRIEGNYFEGNIGRRGGGVVGDQAHFSNLVIANNTFKGNRGNASGGGVGVINCCATTLDHNTFIDNTGSSSYGSQFTITGSPITSIRFNVFSGPTPACSSSFINFAQNIGFNAYSDGGCGFASDVFSPIDQGSMADWFHPPTMNGGDVLTMRPVHGSLPIDFGIVDGQCPQSRDARGQVRPMDGDNDGQSLCDLGAVEASYQNLIFVNGFEWQ